MGFTEATRGFHALVAPKGIPLKSIIGSLAGKEKQK